MENPIQKPIKYRLSFENLRSHLVDIEAVIPTDVPDQDCPIVKLMMPVWTPGSYLVREYARQVERIEAIDTETNQKLILTKTSKNQWAVSTNGSKSITLRYQLYCREQSVRTNWIENDYGFLTGAATFITIDDNRVRPHRLHITPHDSWPAIACSLPPVPLPPDPFAKNQTCLEAAPTILDNEGILDDTLPITKCFERYAKSFDELVDSPILMGDLVIRQFEVNGYAHFLASFGTAGVWDTDQAVKDLEQIVAQEHRFWGDIPYKQYWFMNIAVDAYGGLEHDDCTVLMAKRNAMKQRDTYMEWLGLASHEFFHTWNVRRLRPKPLVQYDYHREQYMNELWIAEGVTSYYDDLILIHAGLISELEYLEQLTKTIRVVEDAPGQLIQSLKDSSHDTWIKHYRPDENTPNARVSYYTKGAAVAFVLDQLLRDRTDNRKSLDDVMRRLWREHEKSGYELADFERIASDLIGESLHDWFQEHVYTPTKINYEPALDRLGLTMRRLPEANAEGNSQPFGAWTPSQPSRAPVTQEIDLGFDLTARDGRWILTKVIRGGAAWEAGLQVDDELIALGGYRIPVANWRERVNEFRVNQKLSTTIARRGKIQELSMVCKIKESISLQSILNPSQIQLDNRRRWLGNGTLNLAKFA